MEEIVVCGSFDDIKSRDVRFLEEAAKFGLVQVCLWSDAVVKDMTGIPPKFPFEERKYFLEAVRYVYKVRPIDQTHHPDELPPLNGFKPRMWTVTQDNDTPHKQNYCLSNGILYSVIPEDDLQGFPIPPINQSPSNNNKKIIVTGCYDWFHSGHVRFFEETSALGDLYVVVGHDENVRLLKGKGHPMFSEDERRYMVGSIKFVRQALISSGSGWMDAEPEIETIKPNIYAVNEDGDKPEKREFCEKHGLEYAVLKRKPAVGLPRRESTHLRGF
jgi:cytidyltransferase-like protein